MCASAVARSGSFLPSFLPTSEEIEQAAADSAKRITHDYATTMRQLAQQEPDRGWGWLAPLFDFHFKPRSVIEPFAPMMVMEGRRSMIPDEQLAALAATFPGLADAELRSRIGDVLWLRRKDSAAARAAVEGYIASGSRLEELDHWTASAERYERAIRLARQAVIVANVASPPRGHCQIP